VYYKSSLPKKASSSKHRQGKMLGSKALVVAIFISSRKIKILTNPRRRSNRIMIPSLKFTFPLKFMLPFPFPFMCYWNSLWFCSSWRPFFLEVDYIFPSTRFNENGLLWRVVSSPPHDQSSTLYSNSCIHEFSNDDAPLLSSVNVLLSIIGMTISIMFSIGFLATEARDWLGCWTKRSLGFYVRVNMFSPGVNMTSAFGVLGASSLSLKNGTLGLSLGLYRHECMWILDLWVTYLGVKMIVSLLEQVSH